MVGWVVEIKILLRSEELFAKNRAANAALLSAANITTTALE
jgi:hypothetical protein